MHKCKEHLVLHRTNQKLQYYIHMFWNVVVMECNNYCGVIHSRTERQGTCYWRAVYIKVDSVISHARMFLASRSIDTI